MTKATLLVALVMLLGGAEAKGKQPTKAFWKVLVKPGAKWVLHRDGADKTSKDKIVVETYDVRKVGDADVARIRWTHTFTDGTTEDIGGTDNGKPTQVAVTDKGLFLLNADNDDAKVTERLQGKPSRSTPVKAYNGTKTNGGRYLSIDEAGVVCMGYAPLDDSRTNCEDTCDGAMCLSETAGVVELSGAYAPTFELYKAK